MGSEDRGFPVWEISPLPGQKGIRLAKKGGGSSLLDAGFRRFQPSDPFPPASLCGFFFAACPLARATSKRVQTTN
jgi:hypothetical protein